MSKFVIRAVRTGIKFDLLAANGQPIAASEVYDSHAACLNGIKSVRSIAATAKLEDQTVGDTASNPKFEVFQDKSGEFRFRLKARNGKIVAVSDGYTSNAACMSGIDSVRKNAADAQITEQT